MNRYQLDDNQQDFKELLLNIKSYFNQNRNTIHKARNELKIIHFNNTDTVVKSFKVPNILRRLVYTYLRDTKAKKSYEYSLKIGEFTPQPIGYIEFYSGGLLDQSYFISKKFDYDFTIREPLLDNNFKSKTKILQQFAVFTYKLHQSNILHKDYSPGNILIKVKNNDYIFKIVDINRMEFKQLSLEERLKNFSKLWASDEEMTVMLRQYAKVSNEDEDLCLKLGIKYNQQHKNKINMKKRLKGQMVD
jgi:hypothetical protein